MASAALVERRMASAELAARELFGYKNGLRPLQRAPIRSVFSGRDTLVILATSGGKSAIYQLPAIVTPGLTLVVSPLVALMKDQVDKLQAWGVAADRICFDHETPGILGKLSTLKLLFVSPERFSNKRFVEALRAINLCRIAADEAHLLSKWSKEFRPAFARLRKLREWFPQVPITALTATADQEVEYDIVRILKLKDYDRFISSPRRPNLTYRSVQDYSMGDLAYLVKSTLTRPGSVLIYVSSRKAAEETAAFLRGEGVERAAYYHAGMDREIRTSVQERFMSGGIPCMVATTAFGMGVDKPDVRLVFHLHAPATVFDYAQQAGRAGRDGKPSTCYLNIGRDNYRRQSFFIQAANPPFYVYERLWRALTRNGTIGKGESSQHTRDGLGRCTGAKEPFINQADVALAFMEYHGHVDVIPGPRVYRLPLRNASLARVAQRKYRGVTITGNVMTVRLAAEDEDHVAEMVASGAVYDKPPEEAIAVRLKRAKLAIDEGMVDEKREKAESAYSEVEAFAREKNKQAFLDRVFLRANA